MPTTILYNNFLKDVGNVGKYLTNTSVNLIFQVTQDFKDFSITSWYENFKSVTPKTVIIEVPVEVLKFFQHKQEQEDSDEDSDYEEPPLPEDLKTELINAFNVLGKAVFVKNNWHAPLVNNLINLLTVFSSKVACRMLICSAWDLC